MTQHLLLEPTQLPGLRVVRRQPFSDARGSFARLFCLDALQAAGWPHSVAQVNHSHSKRAGTVRGLHFQRPPHHEWKLVSCLHGAVWDVAVDVRRGSPTYAQWHAQVLTPENGAALLLPPGFAHGFQCLSDDTELLYVHSQAHCAQADAGLHPMDPELALPWPQPVTEWSERDRQLPTLAQGFEGVDL